MKHPSSKNFLGWVDFSESDARKATDFLASLSEGTLDELGLGRIRDAISERLFPATSTTMQYARYLLIVPALYQYVLDHPKGKTEEQLEDDLRWYLRNRVEADEFKNAREDVVKSKPSAENWSALRKLAILKQDLSRSGYQKLKASPDVDWDGDDSGQDELNGVHEILWDAKLSDAIAAQ